MGKRFMCIWFRHLMTDWTALRHPELKDVPLVLTIPDHGRLMITAANIHAERQGITVGMAAADAKAVTPDLEVRDDLPGMPLKLLERLGEWCIRYTPIIAADLPDGLILDISGCAHLWNGERKYLKEIAGKLQERGYDVRAAIADTIGAAWAIARFGRITPIIQPGHHPSALLPLPAASLRLEQPALKRLQKLGLHTIDLFIGMPRSALRRRFGTSILQRLDQALGNEEEYLSPIIPVEPYQERLPCPEPVRTAPGIGIALKHLLELLCERLRNEGKGARKAFFRGYRIDGKIVQIEIGTSRASHHVSHLFKLFEPKIACIEPALGIELFVLEVTKVEDAETDQETLWLEETNNLDNQNIIELLDRLAGKFGKNAVNRYVAAEHHWPERSIKPASTINEKPLTQWRADRLRPVELLIKPQPIEVTAPIPDYPPMLFRYNGQVHKIRKADGPERIEREWWMDAGEHRDYYQVEDEDNNRYWLFRSGHYSGEQSEWFIHGFFA